jgi:hypothetical protein
MTCCLDDLFEKFVRERIYLKTSRMTRYISTGRRGERSSGYIRRKPFARMTSRNFSSSKKRTV